MYDNVMSVLHNRWIQALGVLFVLAFVAFLFYLISPLLTPILLALLVAYLLNPLVGFLAQQGIRRSISTTALAVVSMAFILAIPLFVVPRIVGQAQELISSARQAVSKTPQPGEQQAALNRLLEWLPVKEFVILMNWDIVEPEESPVAVVDAPGDNTGAVVVPTQPLAPEPVEKGYTPPTPEEREARLTEREALLKVAERIGLFVRNNIAMLSQRYAGYFATAVHAGGSTVAGFFNRIWEWLVTFLAFLVNFSVFAFATGYLLVSFENLVKKARELVPDRYRETTYRLVGQIDQQLRGFVQGQFLVALVNATIYSIGLTIAGVPFGFVIGIITGFLGFIPYLGVILGFTPSVLLVLVRHGLDWHILAVVGTFILVQTIEETLLRPLVLGERVGLHPVWVMASFLVFGHALGFLGILLAVPIAAVLKVFVVEAYHRYRKSKLYKAQKA